MVKSHVTRRRTRFRITALLALLFPVTVFPGEPEAKRFAISTEPIFVLSGAYSLLGEVTLPRSGYALEVQYASKDFGFSPALMFESWDNRFRQYIVVTPKKFFSLDPFSEILSDTRIPGNVFGVYTGIGIGKSLSNKRWFGSVPFGFRCAYSPKYLDSPISPFFDVSFDSQWGDMEGRRIYRPSFQFQIGILL